MLDQLGFLFLVILGLLTLMGVIWVVTTCNHVDEMDSMLREEIRSLKTRIDDQGIKIRILEFKKGSKK